MNCRKTIAAIASLILLPAGCTAPQVQTSRFDAYAADIGLTHQEAVEVYGEPTPDTEWTMALAVETDAGNWQKVLELTETDRTSEFGTCCRNLAKSQTGRLCDGLMDYYQPFERGLFIPVGEKTGRFMIAQSGEVWYRLGEMTMAEHSAILGLSFSPQKKGAKFLRRLGEINRILGQDEAAAKYFSLAGCSSALSDEELLLARSRLPRRDVIHGGTDVRTPLRLLVEANRANLAAYDYLLCYDLLTKRLDWFLEDFDPGQPGSRVYQEAALITLAGEKELPLQQLLNFGVTQEACNDFWQFNEDMQTMDFETLRGRWQGSYWFWFKYATRNEK